MADGVAGLAGHRKHDHQRIFHESALGGVMGLVDVQAELAHAGKIACPVLGHDAGHAAAHKKDVPGLKDDPGQHVQLLLKLRRAGLFQKVDDLRHIVLDRRLLCLFQMLAQPDLELRVAVAARLFAEPEDGGGRHMGGIRKLPDAHIAHLVRVPHNILINFQLQIIQAADHFFAEHRPPLPRGGFCSSILYFLPRYNSPAQKKAAAW